MAAAAEERDAFAATEWFVRREIERAEAAQLSALVLEPQMRYSRAVAALPGLFATAVLGLAGVLAAVPAALVAHAAGGDAPATAESLLQPAAWTYERAVPEVYRASHVRALLPRVWRMGWLRALALRGVRPALRTLPAGLGAGLRQLRRLEVRDCGLESLDAAELAALGGGLRELVLAENELQTLALPLPGTLAALTDLDVSCNPLSELPADALAGLPALRWLAIYSTEIRALPVEGVSSLRDVWAGDSAKLELVPAAIGGNAQLQSLDLSGAPALAALPDSLAACTSLTYLSVAACGALEGLPEGLSALEGLSLSTEGSSVGLSGSSSAAVGGDSAV